MVAKVFNWKSNINNQKGTSITIVDLMNFEQKAPSHYLFEVHMPDLIPFSLIKKIIVPQSHYDRLTDAQKERLDYLMRNSKDKVLYPFTEKVDAYEIEKSKRFYLEQEFGHPYGIF